MLGELVGTSNGVITSTRVLPVSPNGEVRMESRIEGAGKLLGIDMTDAGTFVQTLRSDGVLFVDQGSALLRGAGGEVAHLTGFALGRPTGEGPSAHFASCGIIRTQAAAWKRLNEVAIVCEYDVDSQGHFTVRIWEWKPSQ